MTKMLKFSNELSFPLEAVTQKFDFLGQSGGGKTYDAMKLAELMLEAVAQIVVIDIPGVWKGLRSSLDGKSPGFKVLLVGGEDGDLPINASAGKLMADMVVDTGLSVIFDVSEMLEDDMLVFLIAFISQLFERKKRSRTPMHLFIEECQEVIPEQVANKLQMKLRTIAIRFMKICRNYGVGWSAITQEPQAASKRAINLAGTIIAVRTVGFHERQALERWARSKAKSKEQLALMDILPELEQGQALVWSPGWLKHAGVVHVLPKVTFDSSKTPEMGKQRAHANVVVDIDLDKLKQDMAALVQQAEADDPKLLKKKVAELEKKLVEQLANEKKLGGSALRALGDETLATLKAKAAKIKVVQEPVVLKRDYRILHAAIARWELFESRHTVAVDKIADFYKAIAPVQAEMRALFTRLEVVLDRARSVDKPGKRIEDVVSVSIDRLSPGSSLVKTYKTLKEVEADFGKPSAGHGAFTAPTGPSKISVAKFREAAEADHKLGKGERAVLIAIAQHGEGVTRGQLTVLTGYKRSTRDAYLQRLTGAGLVDQRNDAILATEAAIAVLGDDFAPLPTGEQLRQHWLRELPEGERRVLEVLIANHPTPVPRDAIGEATTYKRSTRDAYIQRLSARKLVLDGRDGMRASPTLFEAA